MTVQSIYEAVRLCFDEEEQNIANFNNASNSDNTLMNHIIKAKLVDALRWISLYAPTEQLEGGNSKIGNNDIDIIQEDNSLQSTDNILTPSKKLVRVIRVKGGNWHRAILGDSLIKEDSDEYLQLRDTNGAAATVERPQAALVNTKERKVEVWPGTGSFVLTYIRALTSTEIGTITDNTNISVPTLLEPSFIYYLAFLVLSAYADSRASRMLEIAKMNLGLSNDKQRT